MSNLPARRDIFKESVTIRTLLLRRLKELRLKSKEVVADANSYGIIFNEAALSRYLKNGNVKGTLSQYNIIWLCMRYGIEVELTSKLTPYNEKKCLNKIKKYYK